MNAELQKVSIETMRFIRGKYALEEVPGKHYDTDCLKLRQEGCLRCPYVSLY